MRYLTIENAYHQLRDACQAMQVFYPGADWLRRAGMAQLQDKITKAELDLLVVIRAVGNPDREDLQEEYRSSLTQGEQVHSEGS